MQCLKCGSNSVEYRNAYNVSEGGGCSIDCTECGQVHDANVAFDTGVYLPMTFMGKALVWGCLLAALAAVCGIRYAFTTLL